MTSIAIYEIVEKARYYKKLLKKSIYMANLINK